jgi:hypothetical protein
MSSLNTTLAPALSSIVQLQFISQLVVATLGLTILSVGIVGNTLNIVIFSALGYYRQNACSLYILSRSVFDLYLFSFLVSERVFLVKVFKLILH